MVVQKGSKIYYIFSFAFSSIPLREKLKLDDKEKTIYLGDYLCETLKKKHGTRYRDTLEWHMSEEKEVPHSRSALYFKFPHLSMGTGCEAIEVAGVGKASKSSHVAIFESGMGILWIAITPNDPVDFSTISKAASLDGLPNVKHIKDGDEGEEYSIHNLFFDEVNSIQNLLNDQLKTLPENCHKSLKSKYPDLSSKLNNNGNIKEHISDNVPFFIKWIDNDDNILWHQADNEFERNGAFQEPTIAIMLKVSKDDLDSLNPLTPGRESNVKLVSSLLHSVELENLDESHFMEHCVDKMYSLFPDGRFKTYFHSNCLLVFHAEDINKSRSLQMFTTGLFRTFCAIRGCWHMFSIINEQIDNTINLFLQSFEEITIRKKKSYSHLVSKQKDIIKAKGHFLTSIAVEDPFIGSVGLSPFSELYYAVEQVYDIKNLKTSIQYKSNELDRLHDTISAYRIRKGNVKGVNSQQASFPSFSLWHILSLLVGIALLVGLVFFNDTIVGIISSPDSQPAFETILWIVCGIALIFSLGKSLIWILGKVFKRG